MTWDARVVVLPGDGLVARFPGIVCVARCPDPGPVERLLAICAEVAGAEPGRALARRLASWLGGVDAPPDGLEFGTVATAGGAVAVFLSGPAEARLGELRLSGADAAAWTDRLVPGAGGAVCLTLPGAGPAGRFAATQDLRDGVVPGAGVELVPAGAGRVPAGAPATPDAEARPGPPGPPPVTSGPSGPVGPSSGASGPAGPPSGASGPAGSSSGTPGPADGPSGASGSSGALSGTPAPTGSPSGPPARPPVPGPGRRGAEPTLVGMEPVEAAAGARAERAGPAPSPPTAVPGVALPDDGSGPGGASWPPSDAPVFTKAAPAPDPDAAGTGPVGPPVATRAPQRAEAILGVDPGEPARAPLEPGDPVGTGSRSVRGSAPAGPKPGEARGHLCSRGHLNDPRSHFCVLCGIRMNERTGVLVIGSRPPLGLLVFDDGATYTVDAEYLVGRMPESDERVRSGTLRSIVVEDRSGAVSRVHAEVRVDGWDVVLVDSGSRNGTYVAGPGEPAWSRLPEGRSHRLAPGTRIRLGARTFVFESPSGVR